MDTCHGVKIHARKNMREGSREWSIPTFSYYSGRKNGQLTTTTNHCIATPMTKAVAHALAEKLNLSGLQSEVCEIFSDPDTLIHDSLVSIGEAAPPPPPPPDSIGELTKAIEHCYNDGLTSLEIINHCTKVVLG